MSSESYRAPTRDEVLMVLRYPNLLSEKLGIRFGAIGVPPTGTPRLQVYRAEDKLDRDASLPRTLDWPVGQETVRVPIEYTNIPPWRDAIR